MKAKTRNSILAYFRKLPNAVLWPGELTKLLAQHQAAWDTYDVSARKVLAFLVENSIFHPAEFKSPKYGTITRYIRGEPSPYRLALSLRRESFLCHHSALEIHGLALSGNTVYANQEQEPKPEGSELTQATIRLAFKNQQRRTNLRFTYRSHEYVLISGKNTDKAGVVKQRTEGGEILEVTDLERTLIDIVVRPAYAGGIQRVADVYKNVAGNIKVAHLLELLSMLDYAYPYQQSIGFLLERAGCNPKDLSQLEELKSEFDFFLDYAMTNPSYSERWRLYYPSALK